jgi:Flp pilus assembly protein TadG
MTIINPKIQNQHQKAQATLELALALPIFMTILLGIFEVALLFFYNVSVNNASREAARYAATSGICKTSAGCTGTDGAFYYKDCTGIKNRAVAKAPGIGLKTTDVTIWYDNGPGTANIASDCSTLGTALVTGNRVVVKVTRLFKLIVAIPGLSNINLSNTTYRTYLGQVTP